MVQLFASIFVCHTNSKPDCALPYFRPAREERIYIFKFLQLEILRWQSESGAMCQIRRSVTSWSGAVSAVLCDISQKGNPPPPLGKWDSSYLGEQRRWDSKFGGDSRLGHWINSEKKIEGEIMIFNEQWAPFLGYCTTNLGGGVRGP